MKITSMKLNKNFELLCRELYANKKYDQIAHIWARSNNLPIEENVLSAYPYLNDLNPRKPRETKTFKKPTINEIKDFIKERKLSNVDAEIFYYYYESNGWKIGQNPMKSWTMTILRWEKNPKNKINNNNTGMPPKYEENIEINF